MGINVEATKIKLFTMMGVIAAFAGVILTLEMSVFFPTQGQGMLLPVMAAVFIGGTSIAGGVGFDCRHVFRLLYHRLAGSRRRRHRDQRLLGAVGGRACHGRLVVLNIVIGDGRIAGSPTGIRHWGGPSASASVHARRWVQNKMMRCGGLTALGGVFGAVERR